MISHLINRTFQETVFQLLDIERKIEFQTQFAKCLSVRLAYHQYADVAETKMINLLARLSSQTFTDKFQRAFRDVRKGSVENLLKVFKYISFTV